MMECDKLSNNIVIHFILVGADLCLLGAETDLYLDSGTMFFVHSGDCCHICLKALEEPESQFEEV